MSLIRSYMMTLSLFVTFLSYTDQQQLTLVQPPALRFYDNSPILLKKDSFSSLISAWQTRLDNTWKNFCDQLEKEVALTPDIIEQYLQDDNLVKIYSSIKEQELQHANKTIIHEEDIHPDVLLFIKRIVQKYCSKKNVKIVLSPQLSTITLTVGTDKTTHYLFCNSIIYSAENVKQYYESLSQESNPFYIDSNTNDSSFRAIEFPSFLVLGLIEAASHIEHQSNLFTFLLSNFKFPDKKISTALITKFFKLTELRGVLSAVLQSKNPLETILFASKASKSKKEKALWGKLVQEVTACYHPASLAKFNTQLELIKQLQAEENS